ncbi:alpha/beta hydrolase [Nocardia rhizosphaerihabitans]|uniref:alpha/beta hydrolase n=1 Tax=Nocardia rhizosphaerihabitans TaxID=1691570 RepID=UPI003670EBA9
MPTPKSIVCGAIAALTLVASGCVSIDQTPTGARNTVAELVDFLDSFVAISCADDTFTRQPHRWPEFAQDSAERAPVYGPFWLYLRQPCAAWPAPETGYPQRFTGPWTQQSPVPALLLNNRFDPATPLTSARRAAQAMGTARLVVVTDGYGHEPTGECATTLRERYLIDLRIPEPDTTCTAGQTPFAE